MRGSPRVRWPRNESPLRTHKRKSRGQPGDFSATTKKHEANSTANREDAKAFSTLQARFAIAGHSLYRTAAPDGSIAYLATRWGMIRELAPLEDAERFLAQIGGSK
jgi:hypothetical protein